MAELEVGSLCKKPKHTHKIDESVCVFCSKSFNIKEKGSSPDLSKLDSLFKACTERENEYCSQLLLDNKADIISGNTKIMYHRNCRSTFVSPMHIKRGKRSKSLDSSGATCSEAKNIKTMTRSDTVSFNWQENCFICGGYCFKKRRQTWSMVESSIYNDSDSQNMYLKILEAAKQRGDEIMLNRLYGIPNGDLVAVEARYHRKRGCYTSYTNPRNIASYVNTEKSTANKTFKSVIRQLKEEYNSSIFEEKEVFLLSTLREKFLYLAQKSGIEDFENYTSQNLKRQLLQEMPDLSFISQPGLSDLVCSSFITVGDALRKALELVNYLKDSESEQDAAELELLPDCCSVSVNEEHILHQAVSILRPRIDKTKALEKEYFSAGEMTLSAQKEFVDPLLYKTVKWLLNKDDYISATISDDCDKQSLTIACDITAAATSIYSPKHLGLGIHLYHEYQSRKLIEDMHQFGYSVSYKEVRRFLTSASLYITDTQHITPSGGIIPHAVKSKEQGGGQPVAAGDNWDHNERTVDGKRTTHAMTSIIVSPQSMQQPLPRIPLINQTSLDMESVPAGGLSSVLHYAKPERRPEPTFDPPVVLDEIHPQSEVTKWEKTTELIYNISRSGILTNDENTVPPWGPFQFSLVQECKPAVSNVSFNPIIMAPPSDYSTIYTTLSRIKEIIQELGFSHVPIFFDMGLLNKALEITWADNNLDGVIPCEGGMHLLMSFIAGIGYLYGDCGLRHLLHESGVFAAGSVEQILSGKDFDRAIYGLKLVDESLNRRFLMQFKTWCDDGNVILPNNAAAMFNELHECYNEGNNSNVEERIDIITQLQHVIDASLQPLLTRFREEGRMTSPTFKVWDDFLTLVMQPFKLFLSATRSGNWKAYEASKANMLPRLFASNRTTYSRYLPVQVLKMKRLPEDIQSSFSNGNFVAKLSEGKFNDVWIDYALESTENKALKGRSGIIGLTLRGNALARWFLSRPVAAKYSFAFHENICQHNTGNQNDTSHHGGSKAKKNHWDECISKMDAMFDDSYIDPFEIKNPPPKLVNFATGMIANNDIQDSMTSCLEKGKILADKFVTERLIVQEGQEVPVKSFYSPLPRSKVKTMSDMKKKVAFKNKNITPDGEIMYLRIMALNAKKKVPLERVMSHENSPIPLSLFHEDGSYVSCNKAEFMHKLEELLPTTRLTKINKADAIIFDGHATIQMLPGPTTYDRVAFKDMAELFFSHIKQSSNKIASNRECDIHLVFDKYNKDSIKNATREKRSGYNEGISHHILPDVAVPKNWKQFLLNGDNKAHLATCYTEVICDTAPQKLCENQKMYISGGNKDNTMKVTNTSVSEIVDMNSNQEEADTRIILHCITASNDGAEKIVVRSPDTDVLVLLLHHRPAINAKEIYFLTGREGRHTNLVRYVPVHLLFEKLTREQHSVLLPVYCLTGCDTTSSFFGHGKRSVFRLMMKMSSDIEEISSLGNGPLSVAEITACTQFVGSLYGKSNCKSLNKVRAEKAGKGIAAKKLPPTDNSLHNHILRVAYQLNIWKNANIPHMVLPSPLDYGYCLVDNELRPAMVSQALAPPELFNDLVCMCQANHCNQDCTCQENGQPCTAACTCQATTSAEEPNDDCTNPFTLTAIANEESDSE